MPYKLHRLWYFPTKPDAVGDGRLLPHMVYWTKHKRSFDSGPFLPLCENDVIHEAGSTYRIALSSEEDGARPIGNVHKNLVKFKQVVLRYASGQTSRHADILIAILQSSPIWHGPRNNAPKLEITEKSLKWQNWSMQHNFDHPADITVRYC